jgi:hypothetical protein
MAVKPKTKKVCMKLFEWTWIPLQNSWWCTDGKVKVQITNLGAQETPLIKPAWALKRMREHFKEKGQS